ncbi:MAG: hypothetical protein IJ193_07090 [Bacilli bacterium]|nr:hypothetical protein [Bacilli bacterium]
MNSYIYLLVPKFIEDIDKKLDALASKYDSPFTGTIIFITIMVVAFAAIRSFSSKR